MPLTHTQRTRLAELEPATLTAYQRGELRSWLASASADPADRQRIGELLTPTTDDNPGNDAYRRGFARGRTTAAESTATYNLPEQN